MREEVYLAAILHDIGKFVERTKKHKVDKRFARIKTGHAKHSAQVVDVLINKSPFFSKYKPELVNLIANHHETSTILEKIIQLADWLSSTEREKNDNAEVYYTVPLKPIFPRVFETNENHAIDYAYPLMSLKLENIFPKQNIKLNNQDYQRLVDSFLSEIGKVGNLDQLYYLLEKYLWSVPAQTTNYIPDISLFDHSRTTAAIALCLYDQYEYGQFTKEHLKDMENSKTEQFMLINGDLSGIQDFIFSIPHKGAAKSLKGRSVYISLISEVIIQNILASLDLKEANLLYSGGGNFYILAPKCKKEEFIVIRKTLLNTLLSAHQGDIYLAMDYQLLAPADFSEFSLQWEKVKNKNRLLKSKKWSELGLEKKYAEIFGPFDEGTAEKDHCHICGVAGQRRKLHVDKDTESKSCSLCTSFLELTNQLKTAKYIIIKRINKAQGLNKGNMTYNDILSELGYGLLFSQDIEKNLTSQATKIYKLNNTDFLQEGCNGFKIGAYQLPIKGEKQITFDDLAKKSQGEKKLGYLKLDVDNLGYLFARGFTKKSSISRLASLSRMLGLYFEGYINQLIKDQGWEEDLYVVFSGGDDTFVIGSWNIVIDFAKLFYQKFREYTCYNQKITFSAGFSIFNAHFPLNMATEFVEEGLGRAKNNSLDEKPTKNSISFLGEVFNWDEFNEVLKLKAFLIEMMTFHSKIKKDATIGRTLLYKIQRNTECFKEIKREKERQRFDKLKLWRLAYSLREIKEADVKSKTNYAERFIQEYNRIVVENLTGKSKEDKINNIMIVPAAIRWAQLETRTVKEE
ncbi:MAG: type III-A CRISPR-associated protein Cas10/Csm1 [Peptococcales bacterium]|jgi:CRISPR-associated protein Csm1